MKPSLIVKLVYVGESYYHKSGTALGVLYYEDGRRADWGFVNTHLKDGHTVLIQPATKEQLACMDACLAKLQTTQTTTHPPATSPDHSRPEDPEFPAICPL